MIVVRTSIFFFLFAFSSIFAQTASNWKIYTDKKFINTLSVNNNLVIAGSNNGAFLYNSTTGEITNYHKPEGLLGFNVTSSVFDNNGFAYLGSADGYLTIFDFNNNTSRTLYDIARTDKDSKRINELSIKGDSLVLSTGYGISFIDIKNQVFGDSYFKLGTFPANAPVNSTLIKDKIYAGTSFGLAVQRNDASNLSVPESWLNFNTQNGLPSNVITKIIEYRGSVLIATESGVRKIENDVISSFSDLLLSINVKDLLTHNDTLYICANNSILSYYNETLAELFTVPANITFNSIDYSQDLGLLASSTENVRIIRTGEVISSPGPEFNQFAATTIDKKGNLWIATGKDPIGKGIFKFDGQNWSRFDQSLDVRNSISAYTARNGDVYVGTWGYSFVKIVDDTNFVVYNRLNTPIRGVIENDLYIVLTSFAEDSKNNLWSLSYGSKDLEPLASISPDSVWSMHSIPAEGGNYYMQHFNLAIDNYDTKWFGVQDAKRTGLFYYNEQNNASGFLSTANGLNNNFITSLVADKRGDIWVGTGFGVNLILNNQNVLQNQLPRITSVFALRQQNVNTIVVDPINQKWIGTSTGLILTNSDGSSIIATFNSKNSPMPIDEVRTISVDENSGKVYVGTDAGLVEFTTPFLKPVDSFTELFVYPNPYILSSNSSNVTIEGLIKDSDIKILSVSGELVAEFSSPGGKIALWNGKDLAGRVVSSGIYFINAYDKEGNSIATGKVAILRK